MDKKIQFVYDRSMVQAKIQEIAEEVQKIISNSKATFFVKDSNVEIPPDEVLYELKAEISNNVGMYFANLLTPTK